MQVALHNSSVGQISVYSVVTRSDHRRGPRVAKQRIAPAQMGSMRSRIQSPRIRSMKRKSESAICYFSNQRVSELRKTLDDIIGVVRWSGSSEQYVLGKPLPISVIGMRLSSETGVPYENTPQNLRNLHVNKEAKISAPHAMPHRVPVSCIFVRFQKNSAQ